MTATSGETNRLEEAVKGVLSGDREISRQRTAPELHSLYRLAPAGDLLIALAVLSVWGMPMTTSVALFSAIVVGSLMATSSRGTVGVGAADLAFGAAGRIGLFLLVALPVAWVDGVAWSAVAAGAVTVGSIALFRYPFAAATCVMPQRTRRAAILGTGPLGLEIAEYLAEHETEGVVAVGMIDRQVRGEMPLPVLGDPDELTSIVADHEIDTVIVTYGAFVESDLVPVLRRCEELPIEVIVLPRFFELSLSNSSQEMWGYPLTRLQGPAEVRSSWRLKRLVDIAGAAALLALTAPVMATVALAVRLSSPGPILYKQERVGHRGRVFEMYKFRSMIENDDGDTTWTVEEDDRITPIGRLIRATHLDELPQLFNVIRGDMSLVGPRPERPHFVELFSGKFENYAERHRVPVGITGWSQVNGLWGDTSIEARSRLDNRYIESWSLRHDLLILLKTIPTLFKGR